MSAPTSPGLVSGVDFVSVPTQDLERSVAFYGDNALMLHHRYAPRSTES